MTYPKTLPAQPLETHWTRVLHCDLYDTPARRVAPRAPSKETCVTRNRTPESDPRLARSPLGSAMLLLGIYIVTYLTVAEVLQVLSPADAATPPAREDRAAIHSTPAMPASAGATGSNHETAD